MIRVTFPKFQICFETFEIEQLPADVTNFMQYNVPPAGQFGAGQANPRSPKETFAAEFLKQNRTN